MIVSIDRCRHRIERAISDLGLDLSTWAVLTEAASGYYALTPLIAALAGAPRVVALGRDSRFGRFADVRDLLTGLAREWGVEDRITITDRRDGAILAGAQLVTNTGFVRPIDATLLDLVGDQAVVALMFEPWEFRAMDVDLEACRRRAIPVAGTDESSPKLRTMEYLGPVACRLLLELDLEIFRSHLLVVGGPEFGGPVATFLGRIGADVMCVSAEDFVAMDEAVLRETREADALVFCEHRSDALLVGRSAPVSASWLKRHNPRLVVAHISGAVDGAALARAGIVCAPPVLAPPRSMSVTTAYCGPRPLIDLHTGGLRVGQALLDARREGVAGEEAVRRAAASCSLVRALP